jgi:NAD(P)-dependent dehydrogenase (short-subunit alcohol dehydrogenase family)
LPGRPVSAYDALDRNDARAHLRSFGRGKQSAAVICSLASDEASFLTGVVSDVSGGRSDY